MNSCLTAFMDFKQCLTVLNGFLTVLKACSNFFCFRWGVRASDAGEAAEGEV